MAKYRKKPVVIEAVQFDGSFPLDFLRRDEVVYAVGDGTVALEIETLEGVMRANKGDWIIRGVKGELYPCKPDIFEQTYEPVGGRAEMLRLTEEQIAELERLHEGRVSKDEWYKLDSWHYVFANDDLVAHFEYMSDSLSTVALHNNASALIEDWRELRRTVEWYATKENWVPGKSFIAEEGSILEGIEVFPIAAISSDKGKLARRTLGLES